jgi:ABC-type branched-subunit amino acid transport system substrate-binding protein
LCGCNVAQGFSNISEAQEYAQTIKEFPDIDIQRTMHPSYREYHRSIELSYLYRILRKMGLYDSVWHPHDIEHQLQDIVKQRELSGQTGNFTVKITPLSEQSDFVVVGPLLGQFHSLVNILTSLKQKNVIDDDFKIIKPETYIIFNGNAADGSPYILETLSLIMGVLKENPTHAFYIKGRFEDGSEWRNFGLKEELQTRIMGSYNSDIPFGNLFGRFFDTLPLAVYLSTICDSENILRISFYDQSYLEIDERSCADILTEAKVDPFQICYLDRKRIKSPKKVYISSIVHAEDRTVSYQNHGGLSILPPEKGATAWSVFSAPTLVYGKYFDFYKDAYSIIRVPRYLGNATISAFNQDVRNRTGFERTGTFNLLSGQKIDLKKFDKDLELDFDTDPLYFGCTLDLSRGMSLQGERLRSGINLRFSKANREGGLKGRPLRAIYLNDNYNPELTRKRVKEFVKRYKSKLFIGCIGSPTLKAVLDMVKDGSIYQFFPTTGAPEFRHKDLKNIIHWRASYKAEALGVITYMKNKYDIKKWSFLYQDDDFGIDPLKAAVAFLTDKGVKNIKTFAYDRNNIYVEPFINYLKNNNSDAIGLFATAQVALRLLHQVSQDVLKDTKIGGLSDLAESSFYQVVKDLELDLIVAQAVPSYKTSTWDIVKEYVHESSEQGLAPDSFSLEGYISASLLIDILSRIDGDITDKKINDIINSFKNTSYKGMSLDFDPQTRELAHCLWVNSGSDKWKQFNTQTLQEK